MDKSLRTLTLSDQTVELFMDAYNGPKKWRWLLRLAGCLPYSKPKASGRLSSIIEDALLGVYGTATSECSWPKPQTEEVKILVCSARFRDLMGELPSFVSQVLPVLVFGPSEEQMLEGAIEERLPGLMNEDGKVISLDLCTSILIAKSLIQDLRIALASEETPLQIDDGDVRLINGRLAIVKVEVDLDKARLSLES